MKKNYILLAIFPLLTIKAFAQLAEKNISTDEQIWTAYHNQTRIADKWGVSIDMSYRRMGDFIQEPFQAVIRCGIVYYINDNLRLAGGYAYFKHYPGRTKRSISQPEQRLWQQAQWFNKSEKLITRHTVRLEERYRKKFLDNEHLEDRYDFNYRFRYNLGFTIPLIGKDSEPKALSLIIGDEVMFNFGKDIIYNYFDQNRLYAAIGYQISRSLNLSLGYMNVFQQLATGKDFNNNHVIRLSLFHNVDIRNSD